MGYTTEFKGYLSIDNYKKLTIEQVEFLDRFWGADFRQHPEWKLSYCEDLTWIDLERSGDQIIWDGSEKTYDLIEKLERIIYLFNKEFDTPLIINGQLEAFGEDNDDMWILDVTDSIVSRKNIQIAAQDDVVISKKEYDNLLQRDEILTVLEAAGVDNWSGYDLAMENL